MISKIFPENLFTFYRRDEFPLISSEVSSSVRDVSTSRKICWGDSADYLISRHAQNNEGPFWEKIARKSRNNRLRNIRSCGCIGTVD